jgi:hypothetical protein
MAKEILCGFGIDVDASLAGSAPTAARTRTPVAVLRHRQIAPHLRLGPNSRQLRADLS